MGIDGIGKGGGAPPTTGGLPDAGAGPAEKTGKTFQIDPAADPGKAQPGSGSAGVAGVGTVGTGPLERLRAGEIDLDGYLDLKLDEATAHLPELTPADRDPIREMLRARLAGDPMLRDLVQQATGREPPQIPDE